MNTSNDLRFKISKNDKTHNYEISIRLNDECHNGHEDFAITADFWKVGKQRTDHNWLMGGCCHDEILKVRPDLAPFVALHLCDWKGAPLYAKANGFYHKDTLGKFVRYLRLDTSEMYLTEAEDENHFHYLLSVSDIPARWEKEAKAATELLEEMTGKIFESKATSQQFEPMNAEEIAEMERKTADGYYSPEEIAKRKEERKNFAFSMYLAKIEERYTKAVWGERKERDAKLFVARLLGSTCDNLMYYTHTDTLCLNWQDHSFSPMFTPEQIEKVRTHIGELSFPVTVTVKN